MNSNKKNILVLGGCGFIGSHLVKKLSDSGYSRIRVLDVREPSDHLKLDANIEFRTGNLLDKGVVSSALEDIDVVFHLVSSTIPGSTDPFADVQNNLVSSLQLLKQMKSQKTEKLIFLSSGGTCYGVSDGSLITEEHSISPINSYGVIKVAIENFIRMFHHQYGMKYTILRPSNVYGFGQSNKGQQGLIGTFLHNLSNGKECEVWGDGLVVRDYIDVSDFVDAAVKVIELDTSTTFNISSGKGYSINSVIDVISKVTASNVSVKHLEGRAVDTPSVVLSNRKISDAIGWKPVVDLDAGIKNLWQHFTT